MSDNQTGWYMVTLVGKDQVGIVAHVTHELYKAGMNLGEASMMRLGGNFSIMMMVKFDQPIEILENLLNQCTQKFNLCSHVDPIEGRLHDHQLPNVRVTVSGADQLGIVARITETLAQKGFNILNLETDVGGTDQNPIYIMHIEGNTNDELSSLQQELEQACSGVDVSVSPLDTLFG